MPSAQSPTDTMEQAGTFRRKCRPNSEANISGMHLNMTYIDTHTTASRKVTRTKIYNEESWQAEQHTPNPGYLQKQHCHMSEDTGVHFMCATSFDIVQIHGHSQNKHGTNLRSHRPERKEVCSTSYTRTERPTSGLGREDKRHNIIYNQQ